MGPREYGPRLRPIRSSELDQENPAQTQRGTRQVQMIDSHISDASIFVRKTGTRYAGVWILMYFWVIDGTKKKKKTAFVKSKQGLKRWQRPFGVQMIKVE